MFRTNGSKSEYYEKNTIPLSRYPIIGFITGIVSALSGLGGGVVMVPLLAGFMKLKIKKTTSISLGIMPFFTLAMTLYYFLTNVPAGNNIPGAIGYIIPSLVIPMSLGVILCSPLGVLLSQKLHPVTIRIIFAIVLSLVIIRIIFVYLN